MIFSGIGYARNGNWGYWMIYGNTTSKARTDYVNNMWGWVTEARTFKKNRAFDAVDNVVAVYLKPTELGKQTSHGYIGNFELVEKFKDGGYKTKVKHLYWSYDYEVVPSLTLSKNPFPLHMAM